MSDLISRQALRDAMYHEAFETDTEMQRWDSGCWIRYKLFENVIDNLPSAERKRGIWMPIERGDKGYSAGDFICSCCGKPNKCYSVTDYCCSCGAEMKND